MFPPVARASPTPPCIANADALEELKRLERESIVPALEQAPVWSVWRCRGSGCLDGGRTTAIPSTTKWP
jgi:hypothetical protein